MHPNMYALYLLQRGHIQKEIFLGSFLQQCKLVPIMDSLSINLILKPVWMCWSNSLVSIFGQVTETYEVKVTNSSLDAPMNYVVSLVMPSPSALQTPSPCKPLSDGGIMVFCLLGFLDITFLGSSSAHALFPHSPKCVSSHNPMPW